MLRNDYVKFANLKKIGCAINVAFDDGIKRSKILIYNLKQNSSVYIIENKKLIRI